MNIAVFCGSSMPRNKEIVEAAAPPTKPRRKYVAFLLIVILLTSVLLIDIYVSDDDIHNFFRHKGWNIIDRIIFGDHYDDEEK